MPFLVHGKVAHPIPNDLVLELTDAYLAFVKNWKAAGAVDQVWNYTGCAGGCMIVNRESLEELDRLLLEHPLLPYLDFTVEPLVEAEAGSERFIDVFRAMMAA